MGDRLEAAKIFGMGILTLGAIYFSFNFFPPKNNYKIELWSETVPLEAKSRNAPKTKDPEDKAKNLETSMNSRDGFIPFQYNKELIRGYLQRRTSYSGERQ